MLLKDMLVIDAATLYPRFTRVGALTSLDVIDGSTITPLIGEDGRSPEPPDPAYQQILHGVPAADFSSDELLYLPRNVRAHRLYGMSPVEQIALTVSIALRRDMATLDTYRAGSAPDAFATLPKEWTIDLTQCGGIIPAGLPKLRRTSLPPTWSISHKARFSSHVPRSGRQSVRGASGPRRDASRAQCDGAPQNRSEERERRREAHRHAASGVDHSAIQPKPLWGNRGSRAILLPCR